MSHNLREPRIQGLQLCKMGSSHADECGTRKKAEPTNSTEEAKMRLRMGAERASLTVQSGQVVEWRRKARYQCQREASIPAKINMGEWARVSNEPARSGNKPPCAHHMLPILAQSIAGGTTAGQKMLLHTTRSAA